MMDAKLKVIKIVPARRDKHGEISSEERGELVFEIPLDSGLQKKEMISLLDLLSREWVKLDIEPAQPGLGLISDEDE